VASFDAKLRELHAHEDELRLSIDALAAERVRIVAQRADVISGTMNTSVQLQRVLDEQRLQDRELSEAYDRTRNATRLKDALAVKVDGACQKHGGAVPPELEAARAMLHEEQRLLDGVAAKLDIARQRAAEVAVHAADDALAEEAEVVAVHTTVPPVTEQRRRRRRRRRHPHTEDGNSTSEAPALLTLREGTNSSNSSLSLA
jgi:hypothetical protein